MLIGCLYSEGHPFAGFVCGGFFGSLFICLGFCWFSGIWGFLSFQQGTLI